MRGSRGSDRRWASAIPTARRSSSPRSSGCPTGSCRSPPRAPRLARRMPTASISSMNTMHWPPHLRARRLALWISHMTTITSMPMNVAAKPGAGDGHERAVEVGGDRLRQHRLAGTGSAEEQQAALALAAGLLELLARLPQPDDARDLFLRLGLTADVLHLHAPAWRRRARSRAPGAGWPSAAGRTGSAMLPKNRITMLIARFGSCAADRGR